MTDMSGTLIFSFAQPEDESGIVTLLSENNLPYDDIGSKLDHFIVCLDRDRVVGVVGLEPCGKAGLLRSLAVAPAISAQRHVAGAHHREEGGSS